MTEPWLLGVILVILSLAVLFILYKTYMRRALPRFPELQSAAKTPASVLEELERSIGGRIPEILRQVYLDGRIAMVKLPKVLEHPDGEECIAQIFSADARANAMLAQYCGLSANVFMFAADDFGNYYFVAANQPTVYFFDHDLGEAFTLFETADQFWRMLIDA
jgi:hypothetical protein